MQSIQHSLCLLWDLLHKARLFWETGNSDISLDLDILYQSFCCEILETPHSVLAVWMEGVDLYVLDMHVLNICVKWEFGISKRSDDRLLKSFN